MGGASVSKICVLFQRQNGTIFNQGLCFIQTFFNSLSTDTAETLSKQSSSKDYIKKDIVKRVWTTQSTILCFSSGFKRRCLGPAQCHHYNLINTRGFLNSFNEGLPWRPYVPDLSPPNFFLWEHVKDKFYRDRPKNIEYLKTKITSVIGMVSIDQLNWIIGNFKQRFSQVANIFINSSINIISIGVKKHLLRLRFRVILYLKEITNPF